MLNQRPRRSSSICLQRGICEADLARLRERVAAVLSKDSLPADWCDAQDLTSKQRGGLNPSNSLSQLTKASTSRHAVIPGRPWSAQPWPSTLLSATIDNPDTYGCCCTGKYPAIDRLLARKQAIRNLQSLRTVHAAATVRDSDDPCEAVEPHTQSIDAYSPQNAPFTEASQPADGASPCFPDSPFPTSQQTLQNQQRSMYQSEQCNPSELAHSQYTHIKLWRQRRHNAAVTIQKHVRSLLAKQLAVQLCLLCKHARQKQQRMLSACLRAWRGYVCSLASFR